MFSIDRLELLTSFKGKVTELIYFGDTPLGKRFDAYFEGDLSGGVLSGRMRGVDYILVRSDGVAEINVRAAIVTQDGVNISVQISGYHQNGEIKDTYVKMVTGNKDYSWLTSAIIIGKGKSVGGTLEIDYFYES
jgi:Protein of unknown function (DUF3237).